MSVLLKKYGIDQLSVDERILLVEEIWASVDDETELAVQLFEAQLAEFSARRGYDELDEEDFNDLEEIEALVAYSRTRN